MSLGDIRSIEPILSAAVPSWSTSYDLIVWLALGGLALWGVPLGRRFCAHLPAGIWPLATYGLMGLVSRALGPLVGPTAAPELLEQVGGHRFLGPSLVALGLGGWVQTAWRVRRARQRARLRPRPPRALWLLCFGALWPVALGAPWALMPPWALDESLYHLSFSLHGRYQGHVWAPVGHGNGGFFALGDHIAQLALWMGSVCAARGAQIWSVLWCGRAIAALWPRLTARQFFVAQGLFVTSPVVLWQLGTAYVDITQGAFELGALMLWSRGARQRARRAWPFEAALLCGWLCGCAIGCKVLALVWLPLGFVALARMPQQTASGTARESTMPWPRGWSGILAVVTCLPFAADVAHNLCRYHTPLYPFGPPLWPGGEVLTAGQKEALHAFMALHGPRWDGLPLTGLARVVALPWALVFGADFASPRFDGVVGVVPIAWGAVAAVAWWQGRRLRAARQRPGGTPAVATAALLPALHGFVLVRLVVWLGTSLQARFLIAPLWALSWATAILWPTALRAVPARGRGLVRALALVAVVAGIIAFARSLEGHRPHVQLSTWNKDSIGRHRARLQAVPASALCDALAQEEHTQVMLVWTQRLSLFCLGEQRADSYDEAATLRGILSTCVDDIELCAAHLRGLGASHIIVHEGRTEDDFGPVLWQRYLALRARALRPLAAVGPQKLYAIAPSGPRPARPCGTSPRGEGIRSY